MSTAKQIMNKAISCLGIKESPAGSNKVVFNTDYYGSAVSGNAYPWCCAFVWDIFRMCGASNLFYDGQKTAYCPTVRNWAREKGYIVNNSDAQYGDIILFDWGGDGIADHIGFVESYSGGVFTTIEGNTAVGNDSNGGEVMRRKRYASSVQCIVRPRYDGVASPEVSGSTSNSGSGNWKGNGNYYLENPRVGSWQNAMNIGFDTNELEVDNQFGQCSQAFASTHLLWIRQSHYCPTAIKWLQETLNYYGFNLVVDGKFGEKTKAAVIEFQHNRGLEEDGIVGLITTYWLLLGKVM